MKLNPLQVALFAVVLLSCYGLFVKYSPEVSVWIEAKQEQWRIERIHKAKVREAKKDIAALSELCKNTEQFGVNARQGIFDKLKNDPWETEYCVTDYVQGRLWDSFKIVSGGPDKTLNTPDDIVGSETTIYVGATEAVKEKVKEAGKSLLDKITPDFLKND